MMNEINVLIACEESQEECLAFRERGFHAFSCDLQPCKRKGHPEWHILGDVTPYLKGRVSFVTMDGQTHHLNKWHLIIAHPPCTFLCKISSPHMVVHGQIVEERYNKMLQARNFFFDCLNSKANFVAVENPLPMKRAQLPHPDCFVQPYWYDYIITQMNLTKELA